MGMSQEDIDRIKSWYEVDGFLDGTLFSLTFNEDLSLTTYEEWSEKLIKQLLKDKQSLSKDNAKLSRKITDLGGDIG